MEAVGVAGDIESECKALLADNSIEEKDFTEATERYLKEKFES